MTLLQALALVLAGVGAGLTGSIAGLASLVSYPALLAVGLSPLAANVTNTMALVASGVGSAMGSREELEGQAARVRRLSLVSVAGGLIGGLLLILTPAAWFERIVPWLIGVGSLSILVESGKARGEGHETLDGPDVLAGVFAIGIYAGYFGAAAGVLLLALLLWVTPQSLARCNAVKNIVLGLSNGVAALLFAFSGWVDWLAAAPLAVGLFVGGWIGPWVVRHSPARSLRFIIAVAGVGLAFYLGNRG